MSGLFDAITGAISHVLGWDTQTSSNQTTTTTTTKTSTPVSQPTHSGPSKRIQEIQRLAQKDGVVSFYKDDFNPYTDIFGNFFETPVTVDGITYRCKEAAFQAQKWAGNPTLQRQFSNLDGDGAFQKARNLAQTNPIVDGWITDGKNIDAMNNIFHAFFIPGTEGYNALLATGNAYLVEHIPVKGRDNFWGDDFDGTGVNKLGELLMIYRGFCGGTGIVPKPYNSSQTAELQRDLSQTALHVQQAAKKAGICHYPGCQRAVFVDSTTGKASNACSKRHRQLPVGHSPTTQATHQAAKKAGICHYPGCQSPVFVDKKGKASNACSRSHIKLPVGHSPTTQATHQAAKKAGICHYPGCSQPVYVDSTGKPSNACSRSHRQLPVGHSPTTQATHQVAKSVGICHYPGCSQPVFVDKKGKASNACSRSHIKLPTQTYAYPQPTTAPPTYAYGTSYGPGYGGSYTSTTTGY